MPPRCQPLGLTGEPYRLQSERGVARTRRRVTYSIASGQACPLRALPVSVPPLATLRTASVAPIPSIESRSAGVTRSVPNVKRDTLHGFIRRAVKDEAEAIYTDDLKSYIGIGDDETRHETVNHSAEEWVLGDVHTNSIEGVWSLFKRSIVGSFRKMSVKHMDRYLEELEWRFNNRNNPNIFRDTLARIMHTDPLEYKRLIA